MKRAIGGRVRAGWLAMLLTFGAAGAVSAQQLGNPGGSMAGANAAAAPGNAAAGSVTGIGTGVSPSAMPGPGMSAGSTYGLGSGGEKGSGPALNNMRANGTALYMSPDPRAPNVTGRAAPLR